jgi:hypothetical protein
MSSHPYSAVAILLGGLSTFLVFRGPLAKWYRKVRRRKGGVYLWRVDHHHNRARRINGYVGETVSFYFRSRQHMGVSHFDASGGARLATPVKVPAQPWSDLNPRMYRVIKLPWWLCWKWVLRPLETLVILLTWPVYNDAKNRWNPRRIPKHVAKLERAMRDSASIPARVSVVAAHALRYTYYVAGSAVILTGVVGWAVTR